MLSQLHTGTTLLRAMTAFCFSLRALETSRSSKGWQNNRSGDWVRGETPAWRNDGRRPFRIASCGMRPSISRSISTACASLPAAVSGSFPSMFCKRPVLLSERVMLTRNAASVVHISHDVVNADLPLLDGRECQECLEPAQR